MYLDAIEELLNLEKEREENWYPDVLEALQTIAGNASGGDGEATGSGASIETLVKSINGVDKGKANAITEMFNIISNSKITEKIVDNSENVSRTITGLTSAINRVNVDQAKVENLQLLTASVGSLISVSRALTFSAPFLVIGAVMSFALIPIAWAISKAFSMFTPDTVRNIDKGGDALRDVGYSLIVFSGGVAIATALIGYSVLSNPVGLLSLFAVMGLTALTFGLIGRYNENIVDGAWTVAGMSLSLMLFAFSVKTASAFMDDVSMMSMLKLGLVLGGTALIFGIAGKFAMDIFMGALAFAGIGLSLMLLSSPLESISKTIDKNSHILWQLPVMLLGLGLMYSLAGVAMPLILMGSLAFGAIGGSLMLLAGGLKDAGKIGEFDGEAFKDALTGMVEGFTAISLKDMFMIPLKLPAILSMAMALYTIGAGMHAYKSNSDWTDEDSDTFKYTIQSFVEAFSLKDVDYDAVEDAIDATWYMGQNLERLAKGIQAWEDIDFDIELVKANIKTILSTIPSVFADIGKINSGGMEIFGYTFARGDVEDGIESTMNMGKNLINLSKGIQAWETIKFDINLVKGNISAVLSTIPSAFAEIGKVTGKDGKKHVIRDWWGNDVGKDNIEAGIKSTSQMGNTLTSLSKGIMSWQTIDFDINKVKTNISAILMSIPSVFARVGYQAKMSEGIFSDSNHEVGAELVKSFVQPIRSIAELVKNLNKDNINPSNVKSLITGVFGAMGKADKLVGKKAMNTLWGISGAMKKIGKEFPKFNKGLKEFADIISKISNDTAKTFFSIASSMEKMSKSQVTLIKAGGGNGETTISKIIRQTTVAKSTPIKTPEELSKEEKDRIAREKKMSTNDILILKFDSMIKLMTEANESGKLQEEDLEEIKELMKSKGIKIKPQ